MVQQEPEWEASGPQDPVRHLVQGLRYVHIHVVGRAEGMTEASSLGGDIHRWMTQGERADC